jgi:hypothetical protein
MGRDAARIPADEMKQDKVVALSGLIGMEGCWCEWTDREYSCA